MRDIAIAWTTGWVLTFVGVLAYWAVAEAADPGQQYADPLLPCVFVACLGGQAALIVYFLASIARRVYEVLSRRPV